MYPARQITDGVATHWRSTAAERGKKMERIAPFERLERAQNAPENRVANGYCFDGLPRCEGTLISNDFILRRSVLRAIFSFCAVLWRFQLFFLRAVSIRTRSISSRDASAGVVPGHAAQTCERSGSGRCLGSIMLPLQRTNECSTMFSSCRTFPGKS